jgi:putative glycosyltransferase (TIGR04372 family)
MTSATINRNWKRYLAPSYLARKVRDKGLVWCLSFAALFPLAVLLRLILRLLKPLVHIRFGQFNIGRMGVMAGATEMYLCERDAGVHPPKSVDLWFYYDYDGYMLREPVKPSQAVCNQQLDRMCRRLIHVSDWARFPDRLNRMLPPGSEDFIVPITGHQDQYGLMGRFPKHLAFTEEEEEQGLARLMEMGIGPDDKFVCFHARDSAYLDIARPRNVELYGDWSWKNLLDTSVSNYVRAAEKLVELGYFAIRMGKYVKEPIQSDNQRVIDYATRFHSDFMDLFLSSRCTFFIAQTSGMMYLPKIFRRPVVFVNLDPLFDIMNCQYPNGVIILKKYYSEQRGRFLTYREVLELGLGNFSIKNPEHKRLYDSLGLRIVENTPEEILEAAMEMHLRLNSTFECSQEDEDLQRRVLSMLREYPDTIPFLRKGDPSLVFGAHFVRTNQDLWG